MDLFGKVGLSGVIVAMVVLGVAAVPAPVTAEATDLTDMERVAASRKLIQDFAVSLRGELKAAMQAGGPVAAISVCNQAAPRIARDKATETGWSVGRTALRLRSPTNAPDDWERAVLGMFAEKAAKGAELASLEHHEQVVVDGKRVFRYMKAIPTQKPCLACHGSAIDAGLERKIREFYPEDRAVGFSLGDLRGAFTITQPME